MTPRPGKADWGQGRAAGCRASLGETGNNLISVVRVALQPFEYTENHGVLYL